MSERIMLLFQGRFISMIFALLVPIVLVRTLSLIEFGIFSLFLLLVQFFLLSLEFGFIKSLFYNIPKDKTNEQKYVFNILYIFMSLSLIIGITLVFSGEFLVSFMNADEILYLLPYCSLYLFFTLSSSMLEPIYTISLEVSKSSQIYIFSEII